MSAVPFKASVKMLRKVGRLCFLVSSGFVEKPPTAFLSASVSLFCLLPHKLLQRRRVYFSAAFMNTRSLVLICKALYLYNFCTASVRA